MTEKEESCQSRFGYATYVHYAGLIIFSNGILFLPGYLFIY